MFKVLGNGPSRKAYLNIMKPTYELKVFYPYGGEHYLLRWWTHNEQHQLFIAKSKEQAEQLFAIGIKDSIDAEPREFLRVDIVAPTQAQCDAYAKNCWDNEVQSWLTTCLWQVDEYYEKHGKLPAKLSFCSSYDPKYDETEEEDSKHYNCKNCFSKLTLISSTFDELYLQHREQHIKRFPRSDSKKAVKSRAPQADTSKPIYHVNTSFGHHCTGVVLGDSANLSFQDTLFFYQNPTDVDMSVVKQMMQEKKKEHEMSVLERGAKRKAVYEKEKQDRLDELLSIFG